MYLFLFNTFTLNTDCYFFKFFVRVIVEIRENLDRQDIRDLRYDAHAPRSVRVNILNE